MSKPSTLPTWATTGGTTIEPSSGQKAAGFAVSTRPPARWMNWILNWLCQWATYLSNGIFTGGIQSTGVTTTPGVEAVGSTTGPALKVTPDGSATMAAERIGTQAAPSVAGLIGDRYTDSVGIVRTCRVAATPGTFRAIGAPGVEFIKTSTGSYTPTVGCSAFIATAIGGGGSGGGAGHGGGGSASVGGGGGPGGIASILVSAANFNAPYSYDCGDGGVAVSGSVSGNNGYETWMKNASAVKIVSAYFGYGGTNTSIGSIAVGQTLCVVGGRSAQGAAGTFKGGTGHGGSGFVSYGIGGHGGNGGGSLYGAGASGGILSSASGDQYAVGADAAATNYGAGGGGAVSINHEANVLGGAGMAGCLHIVEYF